MEIGLYISANIIYLVRELFLGDHIGSFSLLERSFIVLALDIHVFCLHVEAEGAIPHAAKGLWNALRI